MDIFKRNKKKTKPTIEDKTDMVGNSKDKLRESPFQGPRAFSKNDKDWFFGRDEEGEKILSLTLGHKCILIYSKSGAGKSSILNAKVISDLEEIGLSVLPVARIGSTFIDSSLTASNPYMSNALKEIIKDETLPTECKSISTDITLSQFLKKFVNINNEKDSSKKQEKKQRPYVLIFDQLEEIFNLYPDSWRLKQQDFFEQIASAFEMDDLKLRVVLVIREDYVANLDSYSEILPEKLRQRLRIEPLTREQAREAIENPLEKAKSYYQDPNINERVDYLLNTKSHIGTQQQDKKSLLGKLAFKEKKNRYENKSNEDNIIIPESETMSLIDKIINNLSSMRIVTPDEKTTDEVGGLIEPIYLQVVCDKLWRKLNLIQRKEVTPQFLENLGNVDNALVDLYVDAIKEAATSNSKGSSWFNLNTLVTNWFNLVTKEDHIRNWIEKKLITSNDTRGSTYKDPTKKERIPEEALKVLERKYLIRVDRRPSGRWYELTHDSLIKPIKKSNKERRDYVTKKRYNMLFILIGISVIYITTSPYLFKSEPEVYTLSLKPAFIAVDEQNNKVYVSSAASNSISVIDSTSNKLIDNIEVDSVQKNLEFNPHTDKIYVSYNNSKTISSIDIKTKKIDPIILDYEPGNIAVNPNTNEIYVTPLPVLESTNKVLKSKVLVFENFTSLRANQIQKNISVPFESKIKVDPTTNKIYLFDSYNNNTVSVIDGTTNKVIDTIRLDHVPNDISFNPKTNTIYVESSDSISSDKYLTLIDGTTNQIIGNNSYFLSANSSDVIVDPYTNTAYAARHDPLNDTNSISVINVTNNGTNITRNKDNPISNIQTNDIIMNKVKEIPISNIQTNDIIMNKVKEIPISLYPTDIAVNPNTNTIYAFDNLYGDTLSVINSTTGSENTIKLAYNIINIFTNPPTNTVYLGARDDNFNYFILSLNGITNEIDNIVPISLYPTDIAVNPNTNTIYAFDNLYGDTLSVINSTTGSEEIIKGYNLLAIAVNPNTNNIYLVTATDINEDKNKITVIDGKIKEDIKLNYVPGNIAVNPNTNEIYVTPMSDPEKDYGIKSEKNYVMTIINATTKQKTNEVRLEDNPNYIAINPNTNTIYTYSAGSSSIRVYDFVSSTPTPDSIPLRGDSFDNILGLMINPRTNDIIIYDYDSISIIDDESKLMIEDIPIDENLFDLAFDVTDQKMYVSDYDSNTLYVVNEKTHGIETAIQGSQSNSSTVGYQPIDMVKDTEEGFLYIMDEGFISKLNTKTNKLNETIVLSTETRDLSNDFYSTNLNHYLIPNDISFNPKTNTIYVESSDSISSDKYLTLIDGTTNQIKGNGSILLPQGTSDIAINPNTDTTYLSQSQSYGYNSITSNISIISGTTYKEIASNNKIDTIELSKKPNDFKSKGVGVNPNTNILYVVNTQLNKNILLAMNSTTKEIIDTIRLDHVPNDISFNPKTNTIYVESSDSISSDKYLTLIDGTTNQIIGNNSYLLSANSSDVIVDPYTNTAYAARHDPLNDTNSISVINVTTNEIIKDIPISITPSDIAVNPNTNTIYAINYLDEKNTLSVINSTTGSENTIKLDYNIINIFTNPPTNTVYLGARDDNFNYFILSLNGITNEIDNIVPISLYPTDIAVNPNTNTIYAFDNLYGDTLSVINITTHHEDIIDFKRKTLSQLNKIDPYGIAINPSTNTIYAFDYLYSNGTNISVINGTTNEVIDTIEMEYDPYDLSFNRLEDTDILYVKSWDLRQSTSLSGYMDDHITLINSTTNEIIGNITLSLIDNVIVDPYTNTAYAARHDPLNDTNSISVINVTTNEIIKDIPISITPSDIAVNPNTNTIYAINYLDEKNTVSVINGTTFEEKVIGLDYETSTMFIDPNTNTIYIGIGDAYNYYILSLNGTTNEIDHNIPITTYPSSIIVNPKTNTIYISSYFTGDNLEDSTVSVINGNTFEEDHVIELNHNAEGINLDPNTNTIYVANYEFYGNSTISVINGKTNEVIDSIPLDQRNNNTDIDPYIPSSFKVKDITINPNTNTIYISGKTSSNYSYNNHLLAINGNTNKIIDSKDLLLNNTVTAPYIQPNFKPKYIFIDHLSNTIYISGKTSSSYNNNLLAINGNTNKIIDSIDLDIDPKKMIIDSNSEIIYILGTESDIFSSTSMRALNISDPSNLNLSEILEFTNPIDFSFDPIYKRLFIAQKTESKEELLNSPILYQYSISIFQATNSRYENLGEIDIESIQDLLAIDYDEKTKNIYVLDAKTASISAYEAK